MIRFGSDNRFLAGYPDWPILKRDEGEKSLLSCSSEPVNPGVRVFIFFNFIDTCRLGWTRAVLMVKIALRGADVGYFFVDDFVYIPLSRIGE